ncbi:MAG TPA: hypothetical protein DCO71_05770 [Gammaproteobacteria bacterium]|nr:hypothetical protein [Gammaproteobacteria bacterium]
MGEVPYSCLWSARGILRENPEAEGTTEVVWLQAERLTSGVRDVNRVETACIAGAGCAITWQEDPEGVRPGEGEGPGTGWSGATTASKTDIWYSFISWEDMDLILEDNEANTVENIVPLGDLVLDAGRPQVGINMMTPARLTNNDRCQTDAADGYCSELALPYGIKDQCIDTVEVPLGPQGNLREICVVDANGDKEAGPGDMANLANNAASRPRLNLQPRDTDGDDVVDDAWVIVVSEEDKGLGAFGFVNDEEWDFDLENTGTVCDPDASTEESCVKADQGKDVFWATFNMGSPATSEGIDVDYSLVENVLFQGAQLNQPENNWRTGDFYRPMDTTDMWDFGDYNYLIFNTEIARRTSMMSQPTSKGSLVAMPLWKQGIVNQGGPADIMTRRFVYNQCPIEFEDPEGPVISKVDWVQYLANGANIKIKGTVSELDELKKTGFFIRDAVNTDYVFFEENSAPKDWENFLAENMDYPPCYIQASDEAPAADGTSAENWGEAFDLTPFWDEIGVECECIIPGTTTMNQSAADAVASSSWLSLQGISDAVAAMKQSASAAVESFSWLSLLGISDAVAYTQSGSTSENPYDFTNMECAYYDGEGGVTEGVMYFEDGLNPKYPMGLCMAPAMNLSARTPYTCEESGDSDGLCSGEGAPGSESDLVCEEVDGFGQLCQTSTDPDDNQLYDKLLSWYECPGWDGENVSNDTPVVPGACGTEDVSVLYGSNRDDQSWFMPLEVSKAHRGFIDGDYVSMIYAWSPNFKLNSVGTDRYELYTRRSFDGGLTWTTTPGSFTASNDESYSGQGTVTCETWRDGETSQDDNHVCTDYAAGDVEQSRNVSQLKSMATTILDPRYTAAGGIPPKGVSDEGVDEWGIFEPIDPTDILNPSRYFVVFEDGDNTTVSEGEAEPLNLGYGRGEMFGDNFTVWAETDTGSANIDLCYPNDPHGDPDVEWAEGTGFCNEFDTLEGFKDALSEEASITASAHGDFLYGVWGQFNVDLENDNEFIDGDSMFRRVWYLDDYISEDEAWSLPGTN